MRLTAPATLAAVSASALAVGLGACGGKSGGGSPTTTTVRSTTQVVSVPRSDDRSAAVQGDTRFDAAAIFRREGAGVVTVISTGLQASAADGGGEEEGLGSGFVISDDGEIATNAHVVTSGMGADITKASGVYVKFSDDNQVKARILGFDPFADVALLKVDPAGLHLRPLQLGSTQAVSVGSPVAAIGSPFGEEQSLSVGVVSAKDRSIDSLTGFSTSGALQTDAAINHGNSGGPLLDSNGRVLGINSQIRSDSGDGSGVGFAVPIDVVRRSLAQLRESGKVRYAYLGVSSGAIYPQLVERYNLPAKQGALVETVVPNGPADKAGIKAGDERVRFQDQPLTLGGDLITAVDGKVVRTSDDLATDLADKAPGDSVTVHLFRGEKPMDVQVKLGERPLQTPRG